MRVSNAEIPGNYPSDGNKNTNSKTTEETSVFSQAYEDSECTYDKNGNLKSEVYENEDGTKVEIKYSYNYDSEGNREESYKTEYTYDKDGKLISETHYSDNDSDGNIDETYHVENEYYSDGSLKSKNSYNDYDGDGNIDIYHNLSYTYDYDEDGNRVSGKVVSTDNQSDSAITTYFNCDENGDPIWYTP